MKHLILFMLILSSLFARAQSVDFDISLSGKNVPKYVHYQVLEPMSFIDSLEVNADGKASLHLDNVADYQFFRFLVNGQIFFMIIQPGENIVVDFSTDDLLDSKILNSSESIHILEGLRIVRDADSAKLKSQLIKFMKAKPAMLSNLIFFEKLDFDADFKFVKYLYGEMCKVSKTSSGYSNIPAFKDLGARIHSHQLQAKGSKIPDFKIPEIEGGREAGPSDFLGSDFAIVFFAAWNNFSVDEIQTYFQANPSKKILAIMLDSDKDLALSAIQKLNNKNAVYCSELKYFDCGIADELNVTKLPTIIELDKKGRVK